MVNQTYFLFVSLKTQKAGNIFDQISQDVGNMQIQMVSNECFLILRKKQININATMAAWLSIIGHFLFTNREKH